MSEKKLHKNLVELFLWVIIITALILTNLSFSTLASVISEKYILFLLVITGSIVLLALDKLIKNHFISYKRFLLDFISGISIACIFYGINIFLEFEQILFFLPIILAISLSTLIVIRTKWVTIILVVAFCFLLGDVYWEREVSEDTIFTFPIIFLKIFALSIVVLFVFYLYKMREKAIQKLTDKNLQLNKTKKTLEKQTKELSNLNKRLESLNQLKSKFISTVSHELRTPLTAVLISSELLRKMSDKNIINKSQLNDFTDIIIKNVQRETKMIDNLLNLSKIEKGKLAEGKREKFSINEIVKDCIETLSYTANKKSLKLQLNAPKTVPKIWGVKEQIQRVITNLLTNAIKFSPKNSKIIVKITNEKTDIKVSVKDFGKGIEKENLIKIFDRFLQLKTSTERKSGTGIGLAICKEIIQAHGGNIWAESKIEKGSIFIFNIPKDLRKQNRKGKDNNEY